MSKMSELDAFCTDVEEKVKQDYGFLDGGDLCFSMVESGEIKLDKHTINQAAQMVAQRIGQA
jgi:hypothetical protein